MTGTVTYRCHARPEPCGDFEVEEGGDPAFCPFCGEQSVDRLGTIRHDWAGGTCPHCGGPADYREDRGIWAWNATCHDCVNGYAVKKPPRER